MAVGFSETGLPRPDHFHAFDMLDPAAAAKRLLNAVDEGLWLPLAAQFPGFRRLVSEKLILKSATENTLFTVATAVPNVVPTPFTLPWIVGEFVLDTVFLSLNRVRLGFLLAAAHGRDLGIKERALNTASAVTATVGWRTAARRLSWHALTQTFGWHTVMNALGWLRVVRSFLWRAIVQAFGLRSLVRLIVSRLPFGTGLIAKGVVAFAGTYTAGRATEYWYRKRRRLGRAARRKLFEDAKVLGRETAEQIAKDMRKPSKAGREPPDERRATGEGSAH